MEAPHNHKSEWHVASCWAFSKARIGQIRRLVNKFLWAGDERMARAKVAWNVITKFVLKGGLGIIDLVDQCRALLAKLVVRGLLPKDELWKTMFKQRCYQCAPQQGGPWENSLRSICLHTTNFTFSSDWEDRFVSSLFST